MTLPSRLLSGRGRPAGHILRLFLCVFGGNPFWSGRRSEGGSADRLARHQTSLQAKQALPHFSECKFGARSPPEVVKHGGCRAASSFRHDRGRSPPQPWI